MQSSSIKFVGIVGIDGSGKSQAFNGALIALARGPLIGRPDNGYYQATKRIPLSLSARLGGAQIRP